MGLVLRSGSSETLRRVFPDPLTSVEARSTVPAFKNLGRGVF